MYFYAIFTPKISTLMKQVTANWNSQLATQWQDQQPTQKRKRKKHLLLISQLTNQRSMLGFTCRGARVFPALEVGFYYSLRLFGLVFQIVCLLWWLVKSGKSLGFGRTTTQLQSWIFGFIDWLCIVPKVKYPTTVLKPIIDTEKTGSISTFF